MQVETDIFVFGSGDCGQLGMSESVDLLERPKKHSFFKGKQIVAIAAGGLHSLALSATGQVFSWGCNDEKALGHDAPEYSVAQVPGLSEIIQVAAGDSISAALTRDGKVYTWGTFRDSKGVMGHTHTASDTLIQSQPTLLHALTAYKIVQVAAGANHLMALTEDGQLFSWGCGEQGQLGRRVLERHKMLGLRPTNVTPRAGRSRVPIRKIVCGSYHTLIVAQDGTVFSMGLNNYGQLGTGDYNERITAEPIDKDVFKGTIPVDASAGEHHSLILVNTGHVLAFGRADSGQLGLGPLGEQRAINVPTPLPNLEGIYMISTGGNHNLAVSNQNCLFSWGFGGMHQLGHGKDEDELSPKMVKMTDASQILQISAGGQHSIILAASNNK